MTEYTREEARLRHRYQPVPITTAEERCPRCKRERQTTALSRLDNKTKICGDCGTIEALWQHVHPGEKLPPINVCVLCGSTDAC
jgi:hypothetical protein